MTLKRQGTIGQDRCQSNISLEEELKYLTITSVPSVKGDGMAPQEGRGGKKKGILKQKGREILLQKGQPFIL